MTQDKEGANRGISVTVSDTRTATMVSALAAVPGMPETTIAALKVAADRFANRPANLTPNLAVAVLAARHAGNAGMAYDGSGMVLFGANRNRDGSVLNVHAEPYLIVRDNGKGWHSRVANIGQDFPGGLRGTVESAFLSFIAAVLAADNGTGEDTNGKRFEAVRKIIESAANEDYAIRAAFLVAMRAGK